MLQYVPTNSTHTGNFQLFANIRTHHWCADSLFLSTGRNLNLKKQAIPQWRLIFIIYSQKTCKLSVRCEAVYALYLGNCSQALSQIPKRHNPIINSFSPYWEIIKPKPGKQAATSLCAAPKTNSLHIMFMCPECKH